MNGLHCRRWLEAVAACDAAGGYVGPRALVAALPAAAWQGAVRGGDAAALLLLPFPEKLDASSRRAAAKALDVDAAALAGEPARGRPWLDARWDAASGAWASIELRSSGRPRPFRPAAFGEPLAGPLAAFAALAPVSRVFSSEEGPAWTLELERGLPWPLFLRCDVSAAFQPRAAQLSLLLRDARVRALDFDGDALWARFSG